MTPEIVIPFALKRCVQVKVLQLSERQECWSEYDVDTKDGRQAMIV